MVVGPTTVDELVEAIDGFWTDPTTPGVLWDLRQADLSKLTSEGVARVTRLVAGHGRDRTEGRTALLADKDLAYGLSRMYESKLSPSSPKRPTAIFRDLDEALAWLSQ